VSVTLAAQQRRMAAHLRDPAVSPAPAGVEDRRMRVYRELVYRNIEGFVNSAFPVLHSLHAEQEWQALVRAFLREHRCQSPLFLEISEEFLAFLAAGPADRTRPFAAELAHYEWLELAVDVAEGEVPAAPPGDLKPRTARARMPDTARIGSYRFPVHRIGPAFQPVETCGTTVLLVYRGRDQRPGFMELSTATGRLLHELETSEGETVLHTLQRLAREWGADPTALVDFGWQQLGDLAAAGAVELYPANV
jgi:hypothetical protein